jgi:hypothetical protein
MRDDKCVLASPLVIVQEGGESVARVEEDGRPHAEDSLGKLLRGPATPCRRHYASVSLVVKTLTESNQEVMPDNGGSNYFLQIETGSWASRETGTGARARWVLLNTEEDRDPAL